jgi:hypothetical protein
MHTERLREETGNWHQHCVTSAVELAVGWRTCSLASNQPRVCTTEKNAMLYKKKKGFTYCAFGKMQLYQSRAIYAVFLSRV